MSKIRIYELARELGVENKAIIGLAVELGMPGKTSHSNSLESEEADQIRRAIIRQALGSAPETVETRTKDGSSVTMTIRRKGNIIRRRRKSDKGGGDEVEEQDSVNAELNGEGAVIEAAPPPEIVEESPTTLDSIFKSEADLDQENIDSAAAQESLEAQPSSAQDIVVEVAAETDTQEQSVQAEVAADDTAAVGMEGAESQATESQATESQATESEAAESEGVELEGVSPEQSEQPAQKVKKDIGPKVLGKIELPQKKVKAQPSQAERTSRASKAAYQEVPVEQQPSGDAPNKKRRSPKDKRSRRREINRSELVDYEGRVVKARRRAKGGRGGSAVSDPNSIQHTEITVPKASKRVIKVDEAITVGELAKQMSLKSGDLIKKLIDLGVLATINQMVDTDTATIVAEDFGFQVESVSFDEKEFLETEEVTEDPGQQVTRAPVVTVMGHVDHGKTSLLDTIRNASVADREHGGITQHIGAYMVELESGQKISFIDTPGHEAFTSMRARGAQVTDIVILVVASDDGVMPQTVEAVNHSKAAGVPIVVAVNKMDKEDANPDRVKQQLAELALQPEDWGGDTMFFPVSALKGDGIKELLEGVLLQAEVLELKADPSAKAKGTVVESQQDKRKGMVATVLVQQGTLRVGDSFVAGAQSGRVRSMVDHKGDKVEEAGPSFPVEITGLNGMPEAGDDFHVLESDAKVKQIAEIRADKKQKRDQIAAGGGPISLEEFSKRAALESCPELPVIIKADVQGSVQAVQQSVEKLSGEKVIVNVVHASVGGVTESDVKLAIASKAIIVGFGVRAEPRAAREAEAAGVQILYYNVIYNLTEDLQKAMVGLLDPIKKEKTMGHAEVRETFVVPKIGTIAGCYVLDGIIKRGSFVRVLRDSRDIYEGKMGSLRRFKDDVKEVQSGYECGIGIERFNDVKVGDVVEVFEFEEFEPTLD